MSEYAFVVYTKPLMIIGHREGCDIANAGTDNQHTFQCYGDMIT